MTARYDSTNADSGPYSKRGLVSSSNVSIDSSAEVPADPCNVDVLRAVMASTLSLARPAWPCCDVSQARSLAREVEGIRE